MTKNDLGDTSGVEDMERALSIALEIDSPVAGPILNNLAVEAFVVGDLRRGRALYEDAVQLAERLGDREGARFTGTNLIFADFFLGDWDSAARALDEFIASCEAGAAHANEPDMRTLRGSIRRARGDAIGATTDHVRAVELARAQLEASQRIPPLAACAAMHAERGELVEARALLAEALPTIGPTGQTGALLQVVGFAERLGIRDDLIEAIDANPPQRTIVWRDAVALALKSDLIAAADFISHTGAVAIEADLRRRGGERLLASGRHAEGTVELERALAFYRSVDASAYVAEIESALAGAQSASA